MHSSSPKGRHKYASADYVIRGTAGTEDDRETQDNMRIKFPGSPASTGLRAYIIVSACLIGGLALVLALTVASLLGAAGKLNSQGAQIRGLNQANARMSSQLGQVTSTVSGLSARLAASDPSADTSLITCADLAQMGLTVTTGGSVSAVPGDVSLNTSRVRLPSHCSARRG
jgi:hypothetical protein